MKYFTTVTETFHVAC